MRKVLLSAVLVGVLLLTFAGVASSDEFDAGQICKEGLREYMSWVLEQALWEAHGVEVDIEISQGACASTVSTHFEDGMVNTQALATSFCQEVGVTGADLNWCVDHVQPALPDIFHGE